MAGSEREPIVRNAVSGLIAAVIFVVIAALTGGSATFIIGGAVAVFVVATLIGYAIGTVFARNRAG